LPDIYFSSPEAFVPDQAVAEIGLAPGINGYGKYHPLVRISPASTCALLDVPQTFHPAPARKAAEKNKWK
jgi:hypothetical protein